jgi:hypothetical protein
VGTAAINRERLIQECNIIIELSMGDFSIAIHGGAGTILKKDLTPELEAAYTKGLADAVASGYLVLSNGGNAIDAVASCSVSLEDCILFNAGKGSVFTKQADMNGCSHHGWHFIGRRCGCRSGEV